MDLTIKPKITKDLILSKYSEETIFEYYLGFQIKPNHLYVSQLRKDRKPTCSFYKNSSNTLCYHDFATGDIYNCFSYVMAKYKVDYHAALRIIANDLGIVKNTNIKKNVGIINTNPTKITEKRDTEIRVEIKDFTDLELKWWANYGITPEILEKFNIYSCKYVWLNGQMLAESKQHCPIYGYYGKKYQGRELWRCYFPKRKHSYRFISNWPAKKIQGYDQLPKKGNLLVITKSLKDVACLYSCNITAIAPCSETLFISDTILAELKSRFKYIVVVYDQDKAGKLNMAKIRREHPELFYAVIPKKYEAKDISDFYKKYGRKKTLEFIKEGVLWLKSKVFQI